MTDPQTTTNEFERGKRYGRKEALNAIMAEQNKYAADKVKRDLVGEIATVIRILNVRAR